MKIDKTSKKINNAYLTGLKKKHIDWIFIIIITTSFLLVYAIPPNWIKGISIVNSYITFAFNNIPACKDYVLASKFQDIASVYFPIMLLITPSAMLSVYLYPYNPKWWSDNFWDSPWLNSLRTIILMMLLIPLAFVTFLIGGTQLDAFPINDSKFYLAISGCVITGYAFWGLVGVLIRMIKSIAKT